MGWGAAKLVDQARGRLADVIGADENELTFTSGATEANNLAILGLAERAVGRRKRILVSAIEHKSVLAAATAAHHRYNCPVEKLAVDAEGRVRLDLLERRLDDTVLAVSIGLANGEIGTRQPISEVVKLADSVGAIVHADAAQALADAEIDVDELGIGLVSLSAHKIYGPQGIGALYVRSDLKSRVAAQLLGGGQQAGLRAGTVPVALCRAFADAAELLIGSEAESERERVRMLRDTFTLGLLGLPGVSLNGPVLGNRHIANCNVRFSGCEGQDLLARMQPRLAASTGSACASGLPEPSHVLTAIGLSQTEASSSIRFSFGRMSTSTDVEQALSVVSAALSNVRREAA